MTRFFSLIIAFGLVGCASSSQPKSETPAATHESTSSNDESESQSKVLNKTCPKGSVMSHGKCTLQVESDD